MKILVSAYLDRNFGDDMFITMLANEFKEHTFYVDGYNTKVTDLLFLPFENLPNVQKINLSANSKKKIEQINNFDAYIKIGGSLFIIPGVVSNVRGLRSVLRHLKRIKIYEKIKTPYFIIGFNTGPFKSKRGERLALKELKTASLTTVRDTASYQFLKENGIKDNLYKYPDILLSMAVKRNMSQKNNCLGISAYRSSDESESYSLCLKFAEISENYIKRTDGDVKIFAFDTEKENDLSVAHTIKHMIKDEYKHKIKIVPHIGDTNHFMTEFATCSTMLTVRFHSVILAIKYRIPFTPIIYSNKTENFLNDIDYRFKRFYLDGIDSMNTKEVTQEVINKRQTDFYDEIDESFYTLSNGHFDKLKEKLNEIEKAK